MTAKRSASLAAGARHAGLQRLLESFIMLDCRLGSHPRLSACVRLIAKDDLLMVAATNLRARDRIPINMSIGGHALWRRQIVCLPDATSLDMTVADGLGRTVRSIIAIPIHLQDEAIGVLTVMSSTPGLLGDTASRAQLLAAIISSHFHLEGQVRQNAPGSVRLGEALRQIRQQAKVSRQD